MPTEKQKMAANKIIENRGNVSKTMREVGYSEETAKNPKNLTESEGWKELMEEHFPDILLAEKHQKLLEKKEVIVRNNNKTKKVETIPTDQIDANAVKAGLDMAYKLKGKYEKDNKQKQPTVIVNVEKKKEIKKALNDI